MKRVVPAVLCLAALSLAAPPALPVDVTIYKANSKTPLKARLVAADYASITLQTSAGEQKLTWAELAPASAFLVKQKLSDPKSARDWLALGKFARSLGLKNQEKNAFAMAVKLDKSLQAEVDAAINPREAGATTQPGGGMPAPSTKPARQPYEPADPALIDKATKDDYAVANKIASTLGRRMMEIQTDHFRCFTDWPVAQHAILRDGLENAYRLSATVLQADPKDNVFVGKLAVFVFEQRVDFDRFAETLDQTNARFLVGGYFRAMPDGRGRLAMVKTDASVPLPQWAGILTKQVALAFLNRYHTDERLPRWLGEGLAAAIASQQFRPPGNKETARQVAISGQQLTGVFSDATNLGGDLAVAVQSMVELLLTRDASKFTQYVVACKDGEDPEAALRRIFNVDYNGLIQAWRQNYSRNGN